MNEAASYDPLPYCFFFPTDKDTSLVMLFFKTTVTKPKAFTLLACNLFKLPWGRVSGFPCPDFKQYHLLNSAHRDPFLGWLWGLKQRRMDRNSIVVLPWFRRIDSMSIIKGGEGGCFWCTPKEIPWHRTRDRSSPPDNFWFFKHCEKSKSMNGFKSKSLGYHTSSFTDSFECFSDFGLGAAAAWADGAGVGVGEGALGLPPFFPFFLSPLTSVDCGKRSKVSWMKWISRLSA